MFASWSVPFIIIWSSLVIVIQLSNAKFIGDPIRVTARFQVSDETQSALNQRFEDFSNVLVMEKEAKEIKPRPFLNSNGQIDFYYSVQEESTFTPTPATSSPRTTTSRYKTTLKPVISFKPTSTTTEISPTTPSMMKKATSRPPVTEVTIVDPLQPFDAGPLSYYKPTFRPSVMVAEISNVNALNEAASVVTSASAEATTTTVDEKIFSVSSSLNQLSSNSIVNILVVFGLPLVTALLSFMGAGPLAIATIAWIIPVAAILISPDLRK